MKARIAVATALNSAISSSEVRALNSCLITTLILRALKCRDGWQQNDRATGAFERGLRHVARAVIRCSPVLRHFVDRRHDHTGRSLMDHVAGSGNTVKPALRDVAVQPCRLRIDVDQSIFITCDDDDGHLQIYVLVAEVKCIWN